jgi:integrase
MKPGRKFCLTPDLANALKPPDKGEVWIADSHLPHFGLRAWAGRKGGGKVFAIRLRTKSGKLVREAFRPERDWDLYHWKQAWLWPIGDFLGPARLWAVDRIAYHKGLPTRDELRAKQLDQKQRRTMNKTLGAALELRLKKLRRSSRRPAYLDQIEDLIGQWIPQHLLDQSLWELTSQGVAEALTDPSITFGSARRLRSFVNGTLLQLSHSCGPLGLQVEEIQNCCRKIIDARTTPPYPEILKITESDFQRYFELLEHDAHWRQSLAIRLYFATGARMQQVLRSRWSDLIEGFWFPFTPADRKCWFEAREPLRDDAVAVIFKVAHHHHEEGIRSCFLFPSLTRGSTLPIKTVQRTWHRTSGVMGWDNLPLSHLVYRHRERTNPSYNLDFSKMYLRGVKANLGKNLVSKVVNRRAKNIVIADSWMVEHQPR